MGQFKSRPPKTGFSRPESSMTQDVDREWRDVYPEDLELNDILAGKGIVVYRGITCRDEIVIEAGSPDPKEYFFPKDVTVKAFVRKE